MEEFASPAPRRVGRPRWLDVRLVFGVVLVLVAVLVGAKVIGGARATRSELAVTHDLAAGSMLQAGDLTRVQVRLPSSAEVYVSDPHLAVGKILDRPLGRGELLPKAALTTSRGELTRISIPFAADAAPSLARGQRIVVWLSTAACPSSVLLDDVTVQDVRADDNASFSSSGSGQDVVLSVAPDLAQRVVTALAIQNATIRAGVLTGGSAPASGALPDLTGCARSASSTP